MKQKRLKKEIVIPAGTIFKEKVGVTTYYKHNYVTLIGLTKDSSGDLIYGIDPDDIVLDEWFEDVENG